MKELQKEEELIIQKKIDGSLSAQEEEQFSELIESSQKARKFYHDMLNLHHSLENDSKNSSAIDFSQEIMQTIKNKHLRHNSTGKTRILPTLAFRANLLAYAAILLSGLVIGSLATYLRTSPDQTLEKTQVSGTIAARPVQDFDYNKDEIRIKTQEFNTTKVKFTTISINTKDTIQCVISGNITEISDENISLLFAEGQFNSMKTPNKELTYSCNGSIIFQINRAMNTNVSNSLSVQFMKGDQIIKQFDFN